MYLDKRKKEIIKKVIFGTTVVTYVGVGIGVPLVKECINYEENRRVFNMIIITDGVETRKDNVQGKEVFGGNLKVSYKDDDTLVAYIYGDSASERYLYTEFVESNIYVMEENGKQIVCLNEEDLTEENYKAFVDNLSSENGESRVQRKRS